MLPLIFYYYYKIWLYLQAQTEQPVPQTFVFFFTLVLSSSSAWRFPSLYLCHWRTYFKGSAQNYTYRIPHTWGTQRRHRQRPWPFRKMRTRSFVVFRGARTREQPYSVRSCPLDPSNPTVWGFLHTGRGPLSSSLHATLFFSFVPASFPR